MTDLHLPRLDLARAVTDALGRGRYVLMTSGDGTPQEITLDLKERDDDLFGTELADTEHDGMVPDRIRTEGGVWVHVQRPADAPPCSDDHGATIPAQGEHHRSAEIVGEENGWAVREPGPRVYEFALQEAKRPPWADAATFDNATMLDAPDALSANAADWVHVYDRVTRERRTLKRPEPDRILTGLRDVAADLRRGYPLDQAAARWAINEAYPERGAPVEPPFGCAALPLSGR